MRVIWIFLLFVAQFLAGAPVAFAAIAFGTVDLSQYGPGTYIAMVYDPARRYMAHAPTQGATNPLGQPIAETVRIHGGHLEVARGLVIRHGHPTVGAPATPGGWSAFSSNEPVFARNMLAGGLYNDPEVGWVFHYKSTSVNGNSDIPHAPNEVAREGEMARGPRQTFRQAVRNNSRGGTVRSNSNFNMGIRLRQLRARGILVGDRYMAVRTQPQNSENMNQTLRFVQRVASERIRLGTSVNSSIGSVANHTRVFAITSLYYSLIGQVISWRNGLHRRMVELNDDDFNSHLLEWARLPREVRAVEDAGDAYVTSYYSPAEIDAGQSTENEQNISLDEMRYRAGLLVAYDDFINDTCWQPKWAWVTYELPRQWYTPGVTVSSWQFLVNLETGAIDGRSETWGVQRRRIEGLGGTIDETPFERYRAFSQSCLVARSDRAERASASPREEFVAYVESVPAHGGTIRFHANQGLLNPEEEPRVQPRVVTTLDAVNAPVTIRFTGTPGNGFRFSHWTSLRGGSCPCCGSEQSTCSFTVQRRAGSLRDNIEYDRLISGGGTAPLTMPSENTTGRDFGFACQAIYESSVEIAQTQAPQVLAACPTGDAQGRAYMVSEVCGFRYAGTSNSDAVSTGSSPSSPSPRCRVNGEVRQVGFCRCSRGFVSAQEYAALRHDLHAYNLTCDSANIRLIR